MKTRFLTHLMTFLGACAGLANAQNLDLPYTSGSSGADGPLAIPSLAPAAGNFGIAYDDVRKKSVRYGGTDTWIGNGAAWTKALPATSPSGGNRGEPAMAYDAARQNVVMYGGYGTIPFSQPVADTWTWNGTTWASRGSGPSARWLHAMAYDAARQEVVMFGGMNFNSIRFADTWIWNGSTWTQRTPANNPVGNAYHCMAYDEVRQEVVMFGGDYRETWTWNGTNWTQKAPANQPSLRGNAAMCFDAARGVCVLFGGGAYLSDTWTWNGTDWTQQSPVTVPPGRYGAGMVYDRERAVAIMAYGTGTAALQDTWAWNGTNWTFMGGPTITFDLNTKADAVWHYTTINVPTGVTLNFARNAANTPVVWLASENVQIDGIINLNGQAASAVGTSGRTSNPAKGGPGGYEGGEGGISGSIPGLAGSGPGGGAGGATTSAAGANATHVGTYGSAFAIPLIGGSGGGGGARGTSVDGGKGGGGGGAILIASTKDITLNGSILAQGGAGGTGGSAGGAGSGGTVRLVADRVLATTGIINTSAGGTSTNSGRVRIEGFARQTTPANLTGNLSQSVPVEGSALSQAGARLFINTVAGQNIASQPTGNTVNPDVIFSQAGEITITVHAQNIPDGTPVTMTINHSTAGVINLPAAGSVTLQACAASFTTTVPAGQGTIQAFATYTVGGTPTP